MKNILKALSILVLVIVPLTHAEEPKVRERVIRTDKVSMNFSEHLDVPAKWSIGRAVVTLKMIEDSTVFMVGGDREVFRLNAPEYVDEATMSEDGKSLVIVVMRSSGFGSDFATLLRVQPEANGAKITRALEAGSNLFDGSRWWLSELGAVSSDGERILAKFGVAADNRMVYRWITVDIVSSKILSEGLTMANSKPTAK